HWIGVDQTRFAKQRLVHLRYFAADRRIDIGSRLHRLDDSRSRTLFQFFADRRQLHKNEIAELLLRVRGNANRGEVAFDAEPFVLVGEFQHGPPIRVVLRRLYLGSTKGNSQTSTGTRFARTSADIVLPGLDRAVATYPMATGALTLGPKPPDVTCPIVICESSSE